MRTRVEYVTAALGIDWRNASVEDEGKVGAGNFATGAIATYPELSRWLDRVRPKHDVEGDAQYLQLTAGVDPRVKALDARNAVRSELGARGKTQFGWRHLGWTRRLTLRLQARQ